MTPEEAQALAVLLSGFARGDKVYVTRPEIKKQLGSCESMTHKQAQALAILVGGRVVDGKVYMTQAVPRGRGCPRCAFSVNDEIAAMGTEKRAICQEFAECLGAMSGTIQVELKT